MTYIDFIQFRENMVNSQLAVDTISQPAMLKAFNTIPKEFFVPLSYKNTAYIDQKIPFKNNRCLISNRSSAKILQALDIQENHIVLDIGCLTGYSSALLSCFAGAVIGIDLSEDFIEQAKNNCATLNIPHCLFFPQAHQMGCPENGPYDIIFIGGTLTNKPPLCLFNQLNNYGKIGTIIIKDGIAQGVIYTKIGSIIQTNYIGEMDDCPMIGFKENPSFVL